LSSLVQKPVLHHNSPMTQYKTLASLAELEQIYHAKPTQASIAKATEHLTAHYRKLIEASPFLLLATAGPDGLDCSPRGDAHGLVHVESDRTLIIPDRRGNNRIDSLRNIMTDPRVALLFLIPGSGTTVRINGTAKVSADETLLASLAAEGKLPRSAIIVSIKEIYFQCARAILRSDLWNPDKFVSEGSLPTPGKILHDQTHGEIDSTKYDLEWPDRAKVSLW
jgi:uncharacterized protein